MEQAKLLVVEDDEDINRILRRFLERDGYDVIGAFSGTEAELRMEADTFDLILLDLMLPGITGEQLIPKIREKYVTPIIVISAKTTLEDKVHVLKNGADDYITKPFERDEVLARVEAVLRRSRVAAISSTGEEKYTCKQLILNPKSRTVTVNGNPVCLTAYEFDILCHLLKNPDRVFTKDQLYQEVWKTGYYGDDNTINVHISNIRKKMKEFTEESYIKTVWGIGFMMDRG
jgi:DNA-binding response OmpR family regulator